MIYEDGPVAAIGKEGTAEFSNVSWCFHPARSLTGNERIHPVSLLRKAVSGVALILLPTIRTTEIESTRGGLASERSFARVGAPAVIAHDVGLFLLARCVWFK